jgi:hypothetical protein
MCDDVDIDEQELRKTLAARQQSGRTSLVQREFRSKLPVQGALFGPDPKVAATAGQSSRRTARLFPMVPVCSMGSWIRHDRLDR